MALTFDLDTQLGLMVITRSHHPEFDEWREFMEGVIRDERFKPGVCLIEDRRGDSTVPTRGEVEIVAAWIRANARRLGEIRWAVVLAPDSLASFGMARVGEFLTDRSGVTLRPFTSIEQARLWASGAALAE